MTSFSINVVGVAGFEPATSWSQTRRDDRATLHPEKCGETGTRTLATVTRRQISNLLRYHSGTSPLSSYAIRTSKRWQMYNKFYIDANILKGIFECFLESIINQCDKNNRNKCDEESNG